MDTRNVGQLVLPKDKYDEYDTEIAFDTWAGNAIGYDVFIGGMKAAEEEDVREVVIALYAEIAELKREIEELKK